MTKSIYTAYAEEGDTEDYLDGAKEWLKRIRKVKGFAVTVPDASTGMTKVIDIAAKNAHEARRISDELLHAPLEVEQFKGVIRGKPKTVRDPDEKSMLKAKAQKFLQASLDAVTVKLGDKGSNWSGYVGGRSIIVVKSVRKAIRYGENIYVMMVRFTQTNYPSPGCEGGSVHKADQGLVFAGEVNLDNTALG